MVNPQDIREARQNYGCYKLQELCKALKQFDNDENTHTVAKLAKKCGMSVKEFLEHSKEAAHFHSEYDDGATYGNAREKLRQKVLLRLREKTLARLRLDKKEV